MVYAIICIHITNQHWSYSGKHVLSACEEQCSNLNVVSLCIYDLKRNSTQ